MRKPNIVRHRERPLALLPIRSPAVSLPRERHRHHNYTNQLRSQSLSDSLHELVPLSYKPALPAFFAQFCTSPLRSLRYIFFFAFLSSRSDVSCQLSTVRFSSAFCFLLSAFCFLLSAFCFASHKL